MAIACIGVFTTSLLMLLIITEIQVSSVTGYLQVAQPKLGTTFKLPEVSKKTPNRVPWTTLHPFLEDWKWAFTSNPKCISYTCDDIEGKIPEDLKGTYYRNGPGKLERGGHRVKHVFDGDGFVSAVQFEDNGQVRYTGRYVETDFFKKEESLDTILFRNVFGTERAGGVLANAFDVNVKNTANTNVMQFGDRLFAFCETGQPYELDPVTLETLTAASNSKQNGPCVGLGASDSVRGATIDNGGPIDQLTNLGRFFTAHPHVVKSKDDDDDEELLVAFRAAKHAFDGSLHLEFLEYKEDWSIHRQFPYTIPDCCMAPHDFCVMNDYYCFFENRMELDSLSFILALKGAAESMTQRLDVPSRLHLVPRNDDRKPIQLDLPPFFCVHTVSPGIETQDPTTGHTMMTIYSTGWDLQDEQFFPKNTASVPFLGALSGAYPDFDAMPPSVLYKTVIDLDEEKIMDHGVTILGLALEFPQVDDDQPHIVYGPCAWINESSGRTTPLAGYCRIDTLQDTIQYWWADDKMFTEELIPVPKQQGSGSWLLGTVHDAGKQRTSLAILDSENFERGPVGWIHLKYSLPCGLHSSFC